MSDTLSRRRLLQAAGGVTFLALVPNGRGAFAVRAETLRGGGGAGEPLPVFLALPYIQPGPSATTLREGAEVCVLAWQTNARPAEFAVTVKGKGVSGRTIAPVRVERPQIDPTEGFGYYNYAATIDGLSLDARYEYRVTMNGATIAEGYFTTRKKRGQKTRFVAFGDNSYGQIGDRMVAFQAYQAKPDFVMNTGDNVYEGGTDNEYARFFFPVYNADIAHPRVGAPLMRSVPYFSVIANHDVHGKDDKKAPVLNFTTEPDSGGYFSLLHLPANGHDATQKTPVFGDPAALAAFQKAAGVRFPRQATYSFDYGDAHFLCLDSNVYVDTNDPALHQFIENDLKATDARWKFVVYHHPAFNVGYQHYTQQHMRALTPLFERGGVDVVLNGHEHNYQRTRPFRFAPSDTKKGSNLNSKDRLIPGEFTIDRDFDGDKKTKPNGIIYVVTGAGGNDLYDIADNDKPDRWKHEQDGNADYIARFVSDRHSLTVVDMDANSLTICQIDQWGNEADKWRVTK